MASFKDREGRPWQVVIDVPNIRLVRERLKFELGKLLADGFKRLDELAQDPVLLVDVLWVLCEEQAAKTGIKPDQFGRALAGDAIEAAFDALREAYADFCPSQRAKPLRALALKIKEIEAAATEKALAEVAALSLDKVLTTSKNSAGNVAESAGSTPAPPG